MDTEQLIGAIDPDELVAEAPPLTAWQHGLVHDMDGVAQFMYRGGAFSPTMSAKPRSAEDTRPEKNYWDCVKKEMGIFLCRDDPKYRELWTRISAFEKKNTTAVVAVIAAFLSPIVGAPAAVLGGFVAICLFAVAKIGKEAYCRYSGECQ